MVCFFWFRLFSGNRTNLFGGLQSLGGRALKLEKVSCFFVDFSVDDYDVFCAFFSNGAFCAVKLGFHFFLAKEL